MQCRNRCRPLQLNKESYQPMKQMTTKTMKIFSLFITTAFLFTSCVKEGDFVNPLAKKLTKIEYDGGSYEAIDYNPDGTLARITNHEEYTGGNDHTVYTFVYANSLITELNGSDGSKFRYIYDNKKVVKTEIFTAGGNQVGYYQYTYQGDKVSKADAFIRVPGTNIPTTPTMRYENEYFADGNLKKIVFYSPATGGNLKKTSEVSFDDYDSKFNTVGLFENNPFLPLDNFAQNNPFKQTHFDANGSIAELVTISYTYDNFGNPLTRKTVSKPTGQAEYTENASFYY
jgi:hypothetical protein